MATLLGRPADRPTDRPTACLRRPIGHEHQIQNQSVVTFAFAPMPPHGSRIPRRLNLVRCKTVRLAQFLLAGMFTVWVAGEGWSWDALSHLPSSGGSRPCAAAVHEESTTHAGAISRGRTRARLSSSTTAFGTQRKLNGESVARPSHRCRATCQAAIHMGADVAVSHFTTLLALLGGSDRSTVERLGRCGRYCR